MSYSAMKVAELKALCEQKGLDIPPKAKKADLIDLLNGSTPVKAEVIEEPSSELAVTFRAGSIQANFDDLEKAVDMVLSRYEGWEPDPEDKEQVEQCARERKHLNSLAKEIDDRRKAVKRDYERPLKEFEAKANAIRDKIKGVSGKLQDVERQADEARRDWLYGRLKSHYEDFAGVLVPVIGYEKIHEDQWLNKTFGEIKAEEAIEVKVSKIIAEWDALKAAGLPSLEEAETRFFQTLDLGESIAYANKQAEDRKRIEAMKAEMQPEPLEQIDEPMTAPPKPTPRPAPIAPPMIHTDKAIPRVMVIESATTEQCKQIGKFCGSIGVTGRFLGGTLEEVYKREMGEQPASQRRVADAYRL